MTSSTAMDFFWSHETIIVAAAAQQPLLLGACCTRAIVSLTCADPEPPPPLLLALVSEISMDSDTVPSLPSVRDALTFLPLDAAPTAAPGMDGLPCDAC